MLIRESNSQRSLSFAMNAHLFSCVAFYQIRAQSNSNDRQTSTGRNIYYTFEFNALIIRFDLHERTQ